MSKEKKGKTHKTTGIQKADAGRYPHQDRTMQRAQQTHAYQAERPIGCASIIPPVRENDTCCSFAPVQLVGHIYVSSGSMKLEVGCGGKYRCVGGANRCTGHKSMQCG